MLHAVRRRRRRQAAALVFFALLAATQGLLWAALLAGGGRGLVGDEHGYLATATSILDGGPWMPGVMWPPLQPLLLAASQALAGPGLLPMQLFQSVLLVGCAGLLRGLWRTLGGSVAAANTAAALLLLHPGIAGFAHWLWPEIPHLFLLLLVFWLLGQAATAGRSVIAGAATGLALLAKSLLTAFWPLLLIPLWHRGRPWRFVVLAALFVAGLLLVTAPALLHGWRTEGRPMIADSSTYNLWVGLNDGWRSDYIDDQGGPMMAEYMQSAPTARGRSELFRRRVVDEVRETGALSVLAGQLSRQYFRLFSAKTLLASQLPGPACAGYLSAYRSPPWQTATLKALNGLMHGLLLAAAAFGLALWRWRRVLAAPGHDAATAVRWLVLAFLGYQLALFLPLHVKARFLLPMLPFLLGFAGNALAALRGPDAAGPLVAAPTPARLAAGTMLAALLLFLAWGGPWLDQSCAR